jgi:biopolymer transport protein ExbB
MSGSLASTLLEASRRYVEQGGFVMLPLVAGTFVLWYAVGFRLWLLRRGTRLDVRALVRRAREGTFGPTRGVLDAAALAAVEAADAAHGAHRPARDPGAARRLRLCDALRRAADPLGTGAVVARTVVTIAPLLGLLGTVTGMIEMFDSLGGGALYTQDGGIAGGIAEALFTTQLGLAVAIPGYFVCRVLERREASLRHELEQLEQHLAGEVAR